MIDRETSPDAPENGAVPSPSIDTPPPAAYNPATVVFGVSLEEAVRKKSTIVEGVPDIVTVCIRYLENHGTSS